MLSQQKKVILFFGFLPPYHPDLNPIERIWALVKGYVAKRNVTFNLNDAIRLFEEKCNCVTIEEWIRFIDSAKKFENDYINFEPTLDGLT